MGSLRQMEENRATLKGNHPCLSCATHTTWQWLFVVVRRSFITPHIDQVFYQNNENNDNDGGHGPEGPKSCWVIHCPVLSAIP